MDAPMTPLSSEPHSQDPFIRSFVLEQDVPAYTTPPSPDTFDAACFRSRHSRSLGLARPEDREVKRGKRSVEFRTSPRVVRMKRLNDAVVERNFAEVARVVFDKPAGGARMMMGNGGGHALQKQKDLTKLVRCASVLGDWKSVAYLLFGHPQVQLADQREQAFSARQALVLGTDTSVEYLAKQRMCASLVMRTTSMGPDLGKNQRPAERTLFTVDQIKSYAEFDDVVGLTVAWLEYHGHFPQISPNEFVELACPGRVSKSSFVPVMLEADDDYIKHKDEEYGYDEKMMYETPRKGGSDSEESGYDPDSDEEAYFSEVIVPRALNHRRATLLDVTVSNGSYHCVDFLVELGSGRLV